MPYGDNCSPKNARPAAASLSPSRGSYRGRRDVRVHRPIAPGRSSLPVPREPFFTRRYPPSEISSHIHSAGSVAVLVNVETTPVQLHATLFPSGDPAGRGISSYLPRPHRCASEGFAEVVGYGVGGGEGSLSGADRDCAVAAPGTDEFLDAPA